MDKNIKKSLQKEIFKKSINGEGHGAVAGNASAKNLNGNGSERLNHFALTHSNSAAKIRILSDKNSKKQRISDSKTILKVIERSSLK